MKNLLAILTILATTVAVAPAGAQQPAQPLPQQESYESERDAAVRERIREEQERLEAEQREEEARRKEEEMKKKEEERDKEW